MRGGGNPNENEPFYCMSSLSGLFCVVCSVSVSPPLPPVVFALLAHSAYTSASNKDLWCSPVLFLLIGFEGLAGGGGGGG